MSQELRRWCLSQLQDLDVDRAATAQYSKLLPSASVDQSEADGDVEALPLLSLLSAESSSSLATYVNILPSSSSYSLGGRDHEPTVSRTYFQMKVDKSAGTSGLCGAIHTSTICLGLNQRVQPPKTELYANANEWINTPRRHMIQALAVTQ